MCKAKQITLLILLVALLSVQMEAAGYNVTVQSLQFNTFIPVAADSRVNVVADGTAACDNRVNNTQEKLQQCVTIAGVREHQAALQAIADANNGNRASGTSGYDDSVAYVVDRMEAAGYNVTVQPFQFNTFIQLAPSTIEQTAPGSVTYGENSDYKLLSQSDPGDVTGLVTGVDLALGAGSWPNDPSTSTSGCEVSDFIGFPVGHIALVQQGDCSFEVKGENAAAAGAIGIIIFNQDNLPGRLDLINGTLGNGYTGNIPVFFATLPLGSEWANTANLELHMIADVFRGEATISNVLAESQDGDPNNVVMAGAHLDSVGAGPGINDNGSGSAVILEVAEQMAKVKPLNLVRFAWWGAEESGLVGSNYYVANLTQEEQEAIALYLNFDMIGSPNFVRFIYDGDGSDFGLVGPPGSDAIEAFFEDFYAGIGLASEATAFSGRSDYKAFFNAGIATGGLFTGAGSTKTPEQAALYGGTAGERYDPCYHRACDTFDNVSLEVLDQNADAVAASMLQFSMNTETINGERGKGNFKLLPDDADMPETE